MVPFYGEGSTIPRLQSHYEETIYFLTTKSPGVPGIHLIEQLNGPWRYPES